MQIDWLTIAAQIVNFLVLVWLLQRFLYGPITRAMARREERIEQRIRESHESRQEAEREAERLREKQAMLDERRDEILDEARNKAEELRESLEREIREKIDEKRRAWHDQISDQQQEFLRELRQRAAGQMFEMVNRILREFADTDLAGQIAVQFIDRLKSADAETIGKLSEAATRTQGDALVESAVALPSAIRGQITRAIHETIDENLGVQYRTREDILLGMRLTVGEQIMEWSANRYLDRLEAHVGETLDRITATGESEAA